MMANKKLAMSIATGIAGIGAVNWLLDAFQFNLLTDVLNLSGTPLSVTLGVIGISGIVSLVSLFKK